MSDKPALVKEVPMDTAPPLTDAGRAAMAALLNPEGAPPAAAIPIEPAAPPVQVRPAPAARKATDPPLTKWNVSDGEGRSGIVEAGSKDAAKYVFMRQHKICDKQQTWTVTPA